VAGSLTVKSIRPEGPVIDPWTLMTKRATTAMSKPPSAKASHGLPLFADEVRFFIVGNDLLHLPSCLRTRRNPRRSA
jgi:hypothetical protein